MAQSGSSKKVASSLVSASCAAVPTVYAAGYARTQSAANRLAAQVAERRAVSRPPAMTIPGTSFPLMPDAPEGALSHPATISSNPKRDAPKAIASAAPVTTTAPVPEVSPPEAPPLPAVNPVLEPTPVEQKVVLPAPPAPMWKDGTYTGWGYSRHGNIEAEVVIENGRIASATISQCRTRYSCSVIDRLPPQVSQRQSPDVDYVSGATQSADAFYGAVVEALNKAK
jgi:uncharacterized protein with FMN-binding domain